MDFSQIQEIIRMVSKHKLTEFILKEGDFKLIVRNQPAGEATPQPAQLIRPETIGTMPAVSVLAPPPPPKVDTPALAPLPSPAADAGDSKLIAIKSPMVGTFYRSPSPDKPPFIKIGDLVDAGSPVCVIEAMKLFNEIESDVKGKVVKILVEDASPVEYDQPLFLLEP